MVNIYSHIATQHPNHLPPPVSNTVVPVTPILVEPARPIQMEQTDVGHDRIDQETIKTQIMEQLDQRLMESELQIKESLSAKVTERERKKERVYSV